MEQLDRIANVIDKLTIVVAGLRHGAMLFAFGAVVGGALAWAGITRAGAPIWVGFVPAVILSFPAFALWQFRGSLTPALGFGEQLRSLPTSVSGVQDDLGAFAESLSQINESPKSPVAYVRAARGTKAAVDAFNASSAGQLLQGVVAVSPAALFVGAIGCLFAAGSFVLGLLIFLAGGLF